jgi:hypothetical protein
MTEKKSPKWTLDADEFDKITAQILAIDTRLRKVQDNTRALIATLDLVSAKIDALDHAADELQAIVDGQPAETNVAITVEKPQ